MALEKYLTEHPMFRWLDSRHVALLAELSATTEFDPGAYIFRQGGDANAFYLILQGRVTVEAPCPDRGSVVIQTITQGDLLGWSWLFAPYTWHFDARALDKTRAILLNARRLREQCEVDPRLGYELMKRFASVMMERLHAAQLQLVDLHGARA
jgi:CRP-like cAMP-binding protein